MAIETINPYTEKREKTYKAMSDALISRKIEESHKAYLEWRKLSLKKRGEYLKKVALVLKKNKEEYAKIITKEMGKPFSQAIAEIEKSALNFDFYAERGEEFLKPERHDTEHKHAVVEYEPLGVLLAVMPWNFPFWQVLRAVAPALMAGNTVVLKHASNLPECTLALEKVFAEAKLPKSVFTSLLAESKQVERIIENDRIIGVTLTGSEKAGSAVASIAGRHIKKSVLELGGSDPFIILKDADIEKAAAAAVDSRLPNSGQVCVSGKRILVEEKIAKKIIPLIVEKAKSYVMGDPMDEKTNLGPLAKKDILEEVESQVLRSVKKGAKVLLGGKRPKRTGFFFEPTVLANVKKGMPAYDEEIFGPVISIIIVKDEKEAVKVANDHRYGLGGAVWSKNEKKAFEVSRALEVGMVSINGITRSDPRFPFGGVKKSGFGRELGAYGIREFTNVKTIIAKE